MSGRKQHYIPRFLLRGFAVDKNAATKQVFVYHKERKLFKTAIEGIGAERDFYSEPSSEDDQPTLDDKLTELDNSMGDWIHRLRTEDNVQPGSLNLAPQYLTNLAIRQGAVRSSFEFVFGSMFSALDAQFQDKEQVLRMLGLDQSEAEGPFKEEIDKLFAPFASQLRARGISKKAAYDLIRKHMLENWDQFFAQFRAPMEVFFRGIESKKREVTRNGHNAALSKGLHPEKRIEILAKFSWVIERALESLILPDSVVLAFQNETRTYMPLVYSPNELIDHVVMPISDEKVLIGRSERSDLNSSMSLNKEMAQCSWDFFVSSKQDENLEGLIPSIGRSIRSYLKQILDEAIQSDAH